MSQLILLSMMASNTLGFLLFKHPMSMGITLMMQTLLICLTTNNMAQNAWFSYILFIVFLGGMLVLFIYMTSVASNELMKKSNLIWKLLLIVLMTMTLMNTMDPLLMPNTTNEAVGVTNSMTKTSMLTEMFNYPYNMMTIVAVVYLLLTLIVVVNITESHQGPLRSN